MTIQNNHGEAVRYALELSDALQVIADELGCANDTLHRLAQTMWQVDGDRDEEAGSDFKVEQIMNLATVLEDYARQLGYISPAGSHG